ncbi:hypothetical protein [Neoroseomonas eburnea]|uniref:hypothetical protein n=1 Tax=Neoroseomonas eburnea TaxID=1346889 RepID=UPI001BA7E067|nr:hypothetical protein [Neoroseomonas eburnea]
MMNGQRLSSVESQHHDSDVVRVALLRRRSRSRALLIVLLGLVALFYGVTVARLGEHAAARQTAAGSSP